MDGIVGYWRRVGGAASAALLLAFSGLSAQAADLGGADWISVDASARTVTMEIVAGATEDNVRWNFNGYFKGAGRLTVPVGYRVVIEYSNADPTVPHSLGVGDLVEPFPAMYSDPQPVFEGGMSSNPTSMIDGTKPGETETLEFTASETGTFALICHMPAHAMTGMFLTMEVVEAADVQFDPAR